jgi:S1-C subfamily serine protease
MGFDVFSSAAAQQVFGVARGLVVWHVTPDTPAALADLRGIKMDSAGTVQAIGDILLGYQGRAIESEGQFAAMLEVEPPKNEIVFDVLREGKLIKVTLHLDKARAKPASNSI